MVAVTTGLEAPAIRAIERVSLKLFGTVKTRRANKRLRQDTRTLVPAQVAKAFLTELDEAELLGLDNYLASPDFEEIALQLVLGWLLPGVRLDELKVNIREELRHGLRHSVGLRTELLVTAADVLLAALSIAFNEIIPKPGNYLHKLEIIAVAAHLTAATAANGHLLRNLRDLVDIHDFARQLRTQVVAVHSQMRLPHLGVSRSVPYDQLYVEPLLRSTGEEGLTTPRIHELALPTRRFVILGDPGAGKSTFAAKLAHDVASDLIPGAEGRVPFLLVLRNFAPSFRTGGKGLAHYLEQVAADPYNLTPPSQAVDYLLRNGRAIVLLDGLDELVEPDLRRKVVQLVDGFVNRYPLVPVIVTARRIGYTDAPLDRRFFATGTITELNDNQVEAYAHHWFALDDSTPELDRPRMANSFLAESKSIAELRSNPLLLALLCAMYSSEHYIPQNLPQVYEQCAIMLFNRWDKMRGIPVPLEFRGRLRGAIQYLAWHFFNAEESAKAMPRHRIIRTLADYLIAKHFDEDDALATAEQFVEFCTDRSWILTDIGATSSEPRYGFTHRTFHEYFAAEHLVRTHPTADQLWQKLRPRVLSGQWEVVAQMALQLLDRNVDGGVDTLLRLVLSDPPTDLTDRATLHRFAARTLAYLHPGHDVITEIVAAALGDALEDDLKDRFYYWTGHKSFEHRRLRDGALSAVQDHCSPGNLPVVRRILTNLLDERIASGHEVAMFIGLNLTRTWRTGYEVTQELHDRRSAILTAWRADSPYASLSSTIEPERLIATFGPWPLYLEETITIGACPSVAEHLLRGAPSPGGFKTLCDILIAAQRPWIPDMHWWSEFDQIGTNYGAGPLGAVEDAPWNEAPLGPRLLLCLPYLETVAHQDPSVEWFHSVPLLRQLIEARTMKKAPPELLRDHDLTEGVREFLISWMRREFDLLPPRP